MNKQQRQEYRRRVIQELGVLFLTLLFMILGAVFLCGFLNSNDSKFLTLGLVLSVLALVGGFLVVLQKSKQKQKVERKKDETK